MNTTTLTLTPENFGIGIAQIYKDVMTEGELKITITHTHQQDISMSEYLDKKLYESDKEGSPMAMEDLIEELTPFIQK